MGHLTGAVARAGRRLVSLLSGVRTDYSDQLVGFCSRVTLCPVTAGTPSSSLSTNSGNSTSETSATGLSLTRKLRYFTFVGFSLSRCFQVYRVTAWNVVVA